MASLDILSKEGKKRFYKMLAMYIAMIIIMIASIVNAFSAFSESKIEAILWLLLAYFAKQMINAIKGFKIESLNDLK